MCCEVCWTKESGKTIWQQSQAKGKTSEHLFEEQCHKCYFCFSRVDSYVVFSFFTRSKLRNEKTFAKNTLAWLIWAYLRYSTASTEKRFQIEKKRVNLCIMKQSICWWRIGWSVEEIRSQSNSFGEDFPARSWKKKKLWKGRDGTPLQKVFVLLFQFIENNATYWN